MELLLSIESVDYAVAHSICGLQFNSWTALNSISGPLSIQFLDRSQRNSWTALLTIRGYPHGLLSRTTLNSTRVRTIFNSINLPEPISALSVPSYSFPSPHIQPSALTTKSYSRPP